jgi:hypothetical protein
LAYSIISYKVKIKNLIHQTAQEYNRVIEACQRLFLQKTQDYGTAWRILRLPSITDQIFIKAQRIRSIQEKGTQKIQDDITSEFVAIVNYCVIALMQEQLMAQGETEQSLPVERVRALYEEEIQKTSALQQDKNHDYGEAWRSMRIESMTDLILMKLYRTKQIEDNDGQTLVSEGVEANYRDMLNYAVFCLIKLNYPSHGATTA